jgi:predicted RNase H-like HicB family nuclease
MRTKRQAAPKRRKRRPSVIRPVPFCTFIASLGRDDLEVRKPIPVTLEPDDDGGYIASFLDANIASGGESVQDAVESLQEMIASSFNLLVDMPDARLGPRMRRERMVLLEFLCRSSRKTMPKEPPRS